MLRVAIHTFSTAPAAFATAATLSRPVAASSAQLERSVALLPVTGDHVMNKGLLTPQNCAVIFIDYQPQMIFGVANIDRQTMLNNVLVLGKAAKTFGTPVILTSVETKRFSGNTWPALLELFPEQEPIERSSMNAWDSKNFVAAVKKTVRKNLV